MRRTRLRLLPLCLAIAGAVHAQQPAPAATWQLCHAPQTLPQFHPAADGGTERDRTPTDISADALDVKQADSTVFSGNVELTRADQWLSTDEITWQNEAQRFDTSGPLRYQDRSLRLTAARASGDQKADSLDLTDVQYQFNQELGNGHADQATMIGEVGKLSGATYSTCPPGQRQWEFTASRITINQETATGVAANAVLRLGKVPVIWLPVVSFPTDDKRRSGVLAPTIGRDDRNGLDLKLPVYLNLAPNYDATLTPRWLSKRGLMLEGEVRWLGERSRAQFEGSFLPNDDISRRDRSYLAFTDTTTLSRHWYARADLKNVSDVNYLSDFGDSIYNTSISLLGSEAGLYGRGRYWNASLTAESWQIANPLLTPGSEPYRRLPRLQAHAEKPLRPWLQAGVSFEATRFTREETDGGRRVDIEPYLRLPLGGAAWYLTPTLAWRYTGYSLDPGLVAAGGDDHPNRSLPVFSLDAGATFERDLHLGDSDFVQTLEPRLYYLRVPYRDQDALPLFDTRELTFNWNSLFRDNRFGGGDRQSDANQATFALTTRILDGTSGRERLSASVGRITYFDTPRVDIPGGQPLSDGGSDWVAQIDWALTTRWNLSVTEQWDPDRRLANLTAVRSQVRFAHGGLFNLAYRYRRNQLEQTDLSFVQPIDGNWNLYGRWNYSLRDRQSIESLGGLEWNSCCMAVRVLARQYIRSFNSRRNLGLYIEIELNGLGSFGRDTKRLLDDAILGYSR